MANTNLTAAKMAKNDEFYTQLADIEREMSYYKKHFYGKKILLNCDDPEESNFWKYFEAFFDEYQLEKLTSTHYHPTEPTYKLEMIRGKDLNGDGKMDKNDIVRNPLLGNGDFRSAECVALLDEADIVVTNPPFSLFREYVALLMEHNKQFIIIGNQNAITYKEIFPLLKNNELWLGHCAPKLFSVPENYEAKNVKVVDGEKKASFGNICWFTNLDIDKRHDKLPLWKDYEGNEAEYPQYDNYNAIEVNKVAEIPCDFYGVMGVPITFMTQYCPEQFEIVGADGFDYFPPTKTYDKKQKVVNGEHMKSQTGTLGCVIRYDTFGKGTYFDVGYPVKSTYKRIFIRRIDQPQQSTEEE